MTKPLNNADNQPESLMDIIDEAYGIVDSMVDEVRWKRFAIIPIDRSHSPQQQVWDNYDTVFQNVFNQLKDLRSLLGLAESFRDYEEEESHLTLEELGYVNEEISRRKALELSLTTSEE